MSMYSSDSDSASRPRILITNDDGIGAKGLRFLGSTVSPTWPMCVSWHPTGPARDSRARLPRGTFGTNPVADFAGAECYTCNGTPVDCVKLSLHVFPDSRPQLILSGINHGSNSGISIFYSGTMGAVLEGCVVGIPAVGFSLLSHAPRRDFCLAATRCGGWCAGVAAGLPTECA